MGVRADDGTVTDRRVAPDGVGDFAALADHAVVQLGVRPEIGAVTDAARPMRTKDDSGSEG